MAHLVQRTKPAPRPVAKLLSKAAANANGTSDWAALDSVAASSSRHSVSVGSVLLVHTNSSTNWDNEAGHNVSLAAFSGEPPLPTHFINPRQLFSNLNQVSSAHPSTGLIQPTTRIVPNTISQPTGSAFRGVTWLHHDSSEVTREDPDPEGIHT
ncbi:hypothetical protein FRC11_000562, partial [Ceratobasidium sp. 423]